MQIELKTLNDLFVEKIFIQQQNDEKEEDEWLQDKDPPLCDCGTEMIKMTTVPFRLMSKGVKSWLPRKCSECDFFFSTQTSMKEDDYYWNCSKHYWKNLCAVCAEFTQQYSMDTVTKEYQTKNLFYVYDDEVAGPYRINDIIELYVTRKFRNDEIFIQPADDTNEWQKIVFPKAIAVKNGYGEKDRKRRNMMNDCVEENKSFQKNYPQLYKALFEGIFSRNLKQIKLPEFIPKEKQTKSLLTQLIVSLGTILSTFIYIIIFFHVLPSMVMTACFVSFVWIMRWFILVCCYKKYTRRTWTGQFWFGIAIVAFLGIAVMPPLIIYLLLNKTSNWNEMQSWMISYCVWGILTYSFVTAMFLVRAGVRKIPLQKIHKVMLMLIGIEFSVPWKQMQRDGTSTLIQACIFVLYPSVSSLLPAVIAGFITNFILEEKFVLKCNEKIQNDILCFETGHGCCEIISSHDYRNSYAFIGGLTSNIIGSWVIIRICGYLITKAHSKMAVYAKRTK
eukprot:132666_1